MRAFAVSLAVVLGAAGCATLNEEQCRVGDWRGVGLNDGAEGRPMGRIEDHAKACAKYGALPDPRAYENGREQGLRAFCTPVRGFREGREGDTYHDVCPEETEGPFLQAYSDGRRVHAAEAAADRAASEASSARSRADRLDKDIRSEEAKLADTTLTDAQKEVVRSTVRRLRNDRERALDEADRAEREERRARRDADDLRARFAAFYGSW